MFNLFVKEKFKQSWVPVENFLQGNNRHGQLSLLLKLIEELKNRGLEKKLRAGISLGALVLSRSKKHVFRADQAWIRIYYRADGTMHLEHRYLINDENEVLSQEDAKESDFFSLIDILVNKPID